MKHFMKRLTAVCCVFAMGASLTGFRMVELDNDKIFSPELIQKKSVSNWAKETVEKAREAELIPVLTDDPAYKAAITREQFAELAVAMVEQVCGEAEWKGEKTFADCDNENVLLAAELGIVSGVAEGKFDPKVTTNREQIAAMVDRAIN